MMTKRMQPSPTLAPRTSTSEGRIARWGLALADWSEHWFPEPFIFALVGVVNLGLIAWISRRPAPNR